MSETTLRGIVCASDALIRDTAGQAVASAGYEVVAETGSVADTLQMLRFTSTDLLVIDNDLPRALAIDYLGEIHEAIPLAAIILIANDVAIHDRAMREGAFGVVYKTQLSELDGALHRAAAWLTDPSLRESGERRTGRDRRQSQDWSKVTYQRRGGGDRRQPPDADPKEGD